MRKKISQATLFIAIIIMVSGCGMKSKPEATVSEFIAAMQDGDIEAMWSKINPENLGEQEEINLFLDEAEGDPMSQYLVEHLKSNAKKITYDIKETKTDGDRAVVSVAFEYVDAGPLFQQALGEFMQKSIGLMFTGKEMTDEEGTAMFVEIMKEQSEKTEQAMVEKSIDINCVVRDGQWYVDELDDEIINVIMSNIMSVLEGMGESMGFDDVDQVGQVLEDANIINVAAEEEIELATLKVKVNSTEEVQALSAEYGDDVAAKEGTKFLLVNMELTNITKSELSAPDSFELLDGEGRAFSVYSSMGVIDDYLEYRDLAPSIKETGTYVYELPEDSADYYIQVGHAETDDVYQIHLN